MRTFIVYSIFVLACVLTSRSAAASENVAIEFFKNIEVIETDRSREIFDRDLSEPPSEELLNKIRGLKVILFPGFLSDFAPQIKTSPIARVIGVKPQFEDHAKVLERWGVEFELLEIESEDTPIKNAERFRDFLQTQEGRFILMSHSKGSIDALECFIRFPIIRTKIAAWMSLQAPFYGSPVADYFLERDSLQEPIRRALEYLGGDYDSVASVSVMHRASYMEEFQKEIFEITQEIPTISFVSTKPDVKWRWDTRFEPFFRDYFWKRGVESDGLIPWQSSILPHTDYVRVDGLDHLWILSRDLQKEISGEQIVEGLMEILIQRLPLSELKNTSG